MTETPFDRLVRHLRKARLRVVVAPVPTWASKRNGRYARFVGRKLLPVTGYFSDSDDYSSYTTNHMVADHTDCFDKISKCPVRIALPRDDKQALVIMKALRYLGSKAGLRASNTFAYLYDKHLFPYSRKGLKR